MVLPGAEVAVRAMVRRWQCELLDVQRKYGFELVEDTLRWLEDQVDAAGGGACAVTDGRGLVQWDSIEAHSRSGGWYSDHA